LDSFVNDGLTFEVSDSGSQGDRVVLALHGFPEDRSCWSEITAVLTASGFRVLAPDQRGYSPGARPRGRRNYRLELLVRDVLALADAAGARRFDLIGHDWGAVVAWYTAIQNPERLRSLTTMSVPHPHAFRKALLGPQLVRSWYMTFFLLPWLPEQVLSARGGDLLAKSLQRSGLDRQTAERYASRARNTAEMTGPVNWYRALPFAARLPMRRVEVPTLYVWGGRDKFVNRAAAGHCAAEVAAPFRFLALEDQSHWLPTAAAAEIAPVLLEHLAATS
jgi:pimeloyl-ACP methyl ester carboxylesterase